MKTLLHWLRAFLSFLEKDMVENPANTTPVSSSQMDKIAKLTQGVVIDEDLE